LTGQSKRGGSVTYVALLRGVNNAGPGTRVAMTDLRALFERLGFRDVRTLLNSGNVIFSVRGQARREVQARIELALASRLGVGALVILLSADEIVAAVRDNPLAHVATDPSCVLVVIPHARSGLRRLQPLLEESWAPEVLVLGERVAYVWCANGVPKSPLWAAVDRALERKGTVRNIATVGKAKALIERAPLRSVPRSGSRARGRRPEHRRPERRRSAIDPFAAKKSSS
jgi:uncharacterized protein (DUF1697 family)